MLFSVLLAGTAWVYVTAFFAIAAGYVILASAGIRTVSASLLTASAVGWVLLAFLSFGPTIPQVFITIGAILAAAGGLAASVVLYLGKEFTGPAAMVFVVANALGALFCLQVLTLALSGAGLVVIALFGIALIAAGILVRRVAQSARTER